MSDSDSDPYSQAGGEPGSQPPGPAFETYSSPQSAQPQYGTPPPGPTFSLSSKTSGASLRPASDLREPLLRRLFRRLGRRR